MISMLFGDFFGPDKHVRISGLGQKVLDNKMLASRVAEEIIEHKQDLEKGKEIFVNDESQNIKIGITLTTTIDDSSHH